MKTREEVIESIAFATERTAFDILLAYTSPAIHAFARKCFPNLQDYSHNPNLNCKDLAQNTCLQLLLNWEKVPLDIDAFHGYAFVTLMREFYDAYRKMKRRSELATFVPLMEGES